MKCYRNPPSTRQNSPKPQPNNPKGDDRQAERPGTPGRSKNTYRQTSVSVDNPACNMAGVCPTFITWVQKTISPVDWVWSQNFERRHLTEGQRAMCSVEREEYKIATEAKKRQAEAGKVFGKGLPKKASHSLPTFVGKLSNTDAELKPAEKAKRTPTTIQVLAKGAEVGERKIIAAKKIKKSDPVITEQVKAGGCSSC